MLSDRQVFKKWTAKETLMADNLVFSISTALPIFLVMLAGWGLRKTHVIDDSFVQIATTLVFYIALPVKLFSDVSQTAFNEAFDVGLILFLIVGVIASVPAAWIIGKLAVSDPAKFGAFVHGSFRGNFIYIGFSLMENITGSVTPKAAVAAAFIIPLYNILAVMVLTYTNDGNNPRDRFRSTVTGIIRNPLIIAIAAGVIVSQISVTMPVFLARTTEYFSALTIPLALITIGASFRFMDFTKDIPPALLASVFKLVLLPLAAVTLAILLHYTGEDLVLVYILFGVPTATTSYIMTAAMKGDQELASNIIMTTTALSVFTMTAFVFVFRTMGII
jgi:malate permease and related proteins